MSLVDYASSDDDDDNDNEENDTEEEKEAKLPEQIVLEQDKRRRSEPTTIDQSPAPILNPPRPLTQINSQRPLLTVSKRGEEDSKQLEPPVLKLPDASLLLSSPSLSSHLANATDHSSRVAAAMAESESRKRDLNGPSSSSHTRSKVLRGNLPHSKRVPDTVGAHLLPPQLTGRSNVVTEDISKLFVKRRVDSSSE